MLVLIVMCLAVLFIYRSMDRIQTDSQPPKINMDTQLLTVSVQDPKSALTQGVTATDDVDGDVTASLLVESISLLSSDGTVSVGYAAFDHAGNVAKAHREVRYSDYNSPRFTLNKPLIYTYGQSFDILSNIGAVDVIDGDIQHRIRATATEGASISTIGTHMVQFRVSNSLGDTVTLQFPVEVYTADTYNASLSLTDYLIYLPEGSSFDAEDYLDTFTVAGEKYSLESGLPRNFSLKTSGQVSTQTPGTYVVEYRVTYTDRNEASPDLNKEYTGYSKLIVVVEG